MNNKFSTTKKTLKSYKANIFYCTNKACQRFFLDYYDKISVNIGESLEENCFVCKKCSLNYCPCNLTNQGKELDKKNFLCEFCQKD